MRRRQFIAVAARRETDSAEGRNVEAMWYAVWHAA
jgi:hypothetical protein